MNKHKKLLSFVLVLVMVLGMFPLNAIATETAAVVEVCEHCKAELTENAQHSTACPTNCTCDPKPAEGEAHLESCKLYISEGAAAQNQTNTTGSTETTGAPAQAEGPKAGDKIWIKPGVEIYKNAGDAQGHKISLPYYIEIKNIETAGEQTWYQFTFTGISSGMALLLHEYGWVKAADTSASEPQQESSEPAQTTETTAPAETTEATVPAESTEAADPNACSCGETAPEKLAEHADSCPRKLYVKSLFEGKTAEALAAEWNTFDAATQADILAMLEVYDKTTFDALNALLTKPQGIPDTEVKLGETKLKIQVPAGAFPAGTTIAVTPVYKQPRSLQSSLMYSIKKHMPDHDIDILSMEIVDITFTNDGEEVQPSEKVLLTFDIPASDISGDTNMIAVLHIDDFGEAELVATANVTEIQDMTIVVEADSFSHYAILETATTYDATLLKEMLNGNDTYEIRDFNVTLNDFDAVAFNSAYNNTGFKFLAGGETGVNSGARAATQGILADTLVDGYPVLRYNNDGRIKKIFDNNAYTGIGKSGHPDIPFEFVYNKNTGYYTYNSGANHAQYVDGKVVLYTDTMAPTNYYSSKTLTLNATGNAQQANVTDGVKITVKKATDDGAMFGSSTINYDNTTANSIYDAFYLRLNSDHAGNIKVRVTYADNTTKTVTQDLHKGVWADYVFTGFNNGKKITKVEILLPDAQVGQSVTYSLAGFLETVNLHKVYTAGLYPFNNISTSYAGATQFNMNTWKDRIESGEAAGFLSSRTIYLDDITGPSLEDEYAYYAMAMEVDFYIPEGGKVNNQDIVFQFNGDDDMWVFVDGKLALDIGGAHTAVEGSINFRTGKTWVENARPLILNGTDVGTIASNVEKDMEDSMFETGYHKMKIFYMERAGTNANCLIKFNLPVVPTGDVNVSKKVDVEGTDAPIAAKNAEFDFEIKVADTAWANKSYSLIEGTTPVEGTFATDENGQFKLKHNQTAIFDGINELQKVTVTEQNPAEKPGEFADAVYTGTTVNNKPGLSDELTTTANGVSSFAFVNNYAQSGVTIYYKVVGNEGGTVSRASENLMILTGDADGSTATADAGYKFVGWYQEVACQNQLGTNAFYDPTRPTTGWVDGTTYWAKFERTVADLTISKTGIKDLDHHEGEDNFIKEETQSTVYIIEGVLDTGARFGPMEVTILGNGSVTLKDLPTGRYTVTEKESWSWRYDAAANTQTVTLEGGANGVAAFRNERTNPLWLSGDNYKLNLFDQIKK